MNPNQPPAQPVQGPDPTGPPQPGVRPPAGLSVPARQTPNESVRDIPEEGFGFADEPVVQQQPVMPPSSVPQPIAPQPTATPQPLPQPAVPVTPLPAPTPTPQLPAQPPAAPPAPMDVLPPQQIPPVPTLAPQQPPTPPPTVTTPTPPPVSQPLERPNPFIAQPIDLGTKPFASSPASAASPTTASYSPPVTHLPDDVAARITETPIQNSKDLAKEISHGGKGGRLKSLFSFAVFVVSIFIAAFLINQFIFQSYYVEGTSMTPTLQNDDRLIISKVERSLAMVGGQPYIPERGQIVVLDSSIVGLNGQHEQLIKRVMGLPGERIRIENGTVTIFNSQNPEGIDINNQLGLTNLQATFTDAPIDITIPSGQVYVMGDNRAENGSYDSRAFGPISGDKIQGRLWARILPIDKAQLF